MAQPLNQSLDRFVPTLVVTRISVHQLIKIKVKIYLAGHSNNGWKYDDYSGGGYQTGIVNPRK